LSTLKLNAKILKALNLLAFENGFAAKITPAGRFVTGMLKGDKNE
jgi:hypothetical protein